jgi:hypothetical protein
VATITLKNIPADLHRKLKKRAEIIALNKEIISTSHSATDKAHRVDYRGVDP